MVLLKLDQRLSTILINISFQKFILDAFFSAGH